MAVLLFLVVVVVWGVNWPVTKVIVADVPPLWATALRFAIAGVMLLVLQVAQGSLIVPRRGDVAHRVRDRRAAHDLFTGFMSIGLQFVPASRAIVLGYTTPLWVIPGACCSSVSR
jgi:drug/metabolite transporter (DMT)-like permease